MKTDDQQSIKPKMRERKLRIDINWHGALKQKRDKTDGHKTRFGCIGSVNFHTNTDNTQKN
jgi:hypothetical protein